MIYFCAEGSATQSIWTSATDNKLPLGDSERALPGILAVRDDVPDIPATVLPTDLRPPGLEPRLGAGSDTSVP